MGACINASLLFWLLRKHGFYAPRPGWLRFVVRLGVALCALGIVLFWLAGASSFWLNAGLWQKAGRLAGVVVAGMVVYFAALYFLGFRLSDFNRRESASPLS